VSTNKGIKSKTGEAEVGEILKNYMKDCSQWYPKGYS